MRCTFLLPLPTHTLGVTLNGISTEYPSQSWLTWSNRSLCQLGDWGGSPSICLALPGGRLIFRSVSWTLAGNGFFPLLVFLRDCPGRVVSGAASTTARFHPAFICGLAFCMPPIVGARFSELHAPRLWLNLVARL